MKKSFLMIMALGVLAWAGCERPEGDLVPEQPKEKVDSVWVLTVKAVMEGDAATKGLAIGEGEAEATTTVLQSIWKDWQKVQVYLDGTKIGELDVTPDAADVHRATLSGEVTTTGITAGSTKLTLLATERDSWDYTGQAGTLLLDDDPDHSIEKNYHYTLAEDVLVTGLASGSGEGKSMLETESATFRNQQSIYRLSFRFQKGGTGDKTAITTQRVTIASAGGRLVQRRDITGNTTTEGPISVVLSTATPEPFFVALRNENTTEAEALNFKVVGSDGVTYLGSKTIPADYKSNGHFVSIKNATLTDRMKMETKSTKVSTAL